MNSDDMPVVAAITPAVCETLATVLNLTFKDLIAKTGMRGFSPSDIAASNDRCKMRDIGTMIGNTGRFDLFLSLWTTAILDYVLDSAETDCCMDPYCPGYKDGATVQ